MDWLLLQLSDSAFPTGGFAHSSGFEAALQLGEIKGVEGFEKFLSQSLWQAGHSALPFVREAFVDPGHLEELDELCDVFLSNHVANRTSRVQGRTLLSTCVRSFASPELGQLHDRVKRAGLKQHHAPLFGATMRELGLTVEAAQGLYLHLLLRGIVSAAVRLGVFGPYQAQRIQHAFAPKLDEVLSRCRELGVSGVAQTAPLLDLLQASHDRLYSRLFQS